MPLSDSVLSVILHEAPDSPGLLADARFEAIHAVLEKGFPIRVDQSADPTSRLRPGPSLIATTAPSASRSAGDSRARWTDFPAATPASLASTAEASRSETQAPGPGAWLPWFPVIDYDRCTNCMQCLSFCLFGVYGVDTGGRIQAQQQDNCKTNCPACSRVCPEAAIMFPKYKAGPINGDVVSDSDLQREKMKIDISALLGGDVYSLLRDRSERARSRFSKERDSDKALAERQKCLTKLGQIVADLPPEVLSSLPSPDEIARKAEVAKARAAQALANLPSSSPSAS